MQIYRNLDELTRFPRNARTHVTIGSFDGLHLGHQALIGATIQSARSMEGHSTVFTFANHPLSLLAPAYRPARIMSDETRIRLIEKLGADSLVLVTFDKVLADMSPEIFVLEVLVKKLHVHQIVTGFNFRFGKDGAGDEKVLAEIGREFGLSIQRLQPVEIDRVIVSSTKIRELLTQGLVALASRFRAAVELSKDEHHVDAKSIMGVLLLCGTQGSTLTISASGEDAQEAVSALVALVSDRFGEAE